MPDESPAAAPAAPATAATVAQGDADETDAAEIIRLQQLLDAARARDKQRTTRIAELEDELHRLKQSLQPRPGRARVEADEDDDWFVKL